jgi:hypothetical protein
MLRSRSRVIANFSNVTSIPSCRQWAVVVSLLALFIQYSSSFSILKMQDYRPPVKTSVKTLQSDRSRTATSTSTHHRTAGMTTDKKLPQQQQQQNRRRFSSPSKSSHAASVALPTSESSISQGVQSFERRMRDLVLGTQKHNQQEVQHTSDSSNMITDTRTPSHVKVIQSLQEYKEIVGDEREKLVVVRFFASYCKVGIITDHIFE